jgi:hypothetical protein
MDEDGSRFETRRKLKVDRHAGVPLIETKLREWRPHRPRKRGDVPHGRGQRCDGRRRFLLRILHSRPFAVAIRGANSTQRRIQVMIGGALKWAE